MRFSTHVCDECANNRGLAPYPFSEYERDAARTNTYPGATKVYDLVMGLCSEAGEVAGLMKKIDRDRGGMVGDADRRHLALELGDVLWYVSELASVAGYHLEDVARMNIEKLRSRQERGTLGGSGDDR